MAAFCRLKSGLTEVKFNFLGRRHRVRFGRDGRRSDKLHIEELLRYYEDGDAGAPLDPKTREWLQQIPHCVYKKLTDLGLVQDRQEQALQFLEPFCESILTERSTHCQATSIEVYEKVAFNLTDYFGNCHLRSITPHRVNKFREHLATKGNRRRGGGLGQSTMCKRLKVCREWFQIAVVRGWLDSNPFGKLRGLEQHVAGDASRKVYVPAAVVDQLIEAAPDAEWALLLALWRYAGLRQLEPFELRWSDIAWDKERMTVTAPKQVNNAARYKRVIPIWPELRPHLDQQWDAAGEGEEFVIFRRRYAYDSKPEARSTGTALYSRLKDACLKLGIPPWPRLTQNLRSSGETDCMRDKRFEAFEVAYWWNHTGRVQEKHYLMVTDAAYAKAVGPPCGPVSDSTPTNQG